ncbi:transposase [Streptomyces sp. NPDC004074]|uniref:transposase n=1 Tax=Streptomyces sp. NPDC004074 TaxID=3154277 RepID=UPI0033B8ED42
MGVGLSQRLVPDGLWSLVDPLLPSFSARPQGGGTAPVDERAVFTAVVYVLTSGCAWRHLPENFRRLAGHRTSPVLLVDRGGTMAATALGRAGRARYPR